MAVNHQINAVDQMMVNSIENHLFQIEAFSHSIHLKLGYCYVVQNGVKQATVIMKNTLTSFLHANGVARNKFHVTITVAWLKVIGLCLQNGPVMSSAEAFLHHNPCLLSKDLLLSYYSPDLLFSDKARKRFVDPDLNPF